MKTAHEEEVRQLTEEISSLESDHEAKIQELEAKHELETKQLEDTIQRLREGG